ncbi:styrene monooxygenase/indole monooxygenase family protein [Saccharopolyspora shandongensis]|uniref:styrene monooxygenase/indole monooxygenase family protein n=1 Tax=Saccharopolyspora shandongensis TaxID=418495 RepID=UPI0033DD1510
MRKVLIVGAGQSGLQLGLSLQALRYEVTLISARTPAEIRGGRIMSTQVMFRTALGYEREHGLNLWEERAPKITGLRLSVGGPDGSRVLDWRGELTDFAQSVDQRVKLAGWLELFAERGGTVEYRHIGASDLDELSRDYDLVLVAAGAGELGRIFERDPAWSPFVEPQRALAVSYLRGAARSSDVDDSGLVRFNSVPGVGEVFVIPGYTEGGPCDILFFEGVPGGPLDCWADRPGPAEHRARMLELLRAHLPWEHERFADAELTDDRAVLAGGVTPVVRKPVARLPSGAAVLGMADAVVVTDPVTGQGVNSACKAAESYLDSIVRRADRPFDREWMQDTFDRFWDYARHVAVWSNAMLKPSPPHVLRLLGAAVEIPAIRNRFANGFDDPADFESWFLDPAGAENYLESLTA